MIDAYARRIVGWRVSRTAHAAFVLDALEQALHERRPLWGGGLVHHSDRGSQYLALRYTERLAEAGVEPSVGSVGDSYDTDGELLPHLKVELVHQRRWATQEEARRDLFAYIESYYNRQRVHSALGYLTPEQAERNAN